MENSKLFESLEQWRNWLQSNHAKVDVLWLIYYKKHTGKKCISYEDSLQEALCWGWIDSTIKRLDDEKYIRKFTPRTNCQNWSDANIRHMKKLIAAERVQEVGLKKFPRELLAKKVDSKPKELIIPDYLNIELSKFPSAKQNFDRLSPANKRNFVEWIDSAKRKETKLRRMAEAIRLLSDGKRLGMK